MDGAVAGSVGVVLLAGLLAANGAAAKTFVVTRHNDPEPSGCAAHDCSLREAVIAANGHSGADTVKLPDKATYKLELTGFDDVSALGDLDTTGQRRSRDSGSRAAR